jgi:hypothetical protein
VCVGVLARSSIVPVRCVVMDDPLVVAGAASGFAEMISAAVAVPSGRWPRASRRATDRGSARSVFGTAAGALAGTCCAAAAAPDQAPAAHRQAVAALDVAGAARPMCRAARERGRLFTGIRGLLVQPTAASRERERPTYHNRAGVNRGNPVEWPPTGCARAGGCRCLLHPWRQPVAPLGRGKQAFACLG